MALDRGFVRGVDCWNGFSSEKRISSPAGDALGVDDWRIPGEPIPKDGSGLGSVFFDEDGNLGRTCSLKAAIRADLRACPGTTMPYSCKMTRNVATRNDEASVSRVTSGGMDVAVQAPKTEKQDTGSFWYGGVYAYIYLPSSLLGLSLWCKSGMGGR